MEPAASSSSIAARVAERYARVPSYRDMLAAQAAARAAAEAAARAAEAAARAASEAAARAAAEAAALAASTSLFEPAWTAPQPADAAPSHDQPLEDSHSQPWQPDLIRYYVSSDSLPVPRFTPAEARVPLRPRGDAAALARPGQTLDPFEEAVIEPASPLPARVIEFPRELVAPRKARPRLAEGPLCEDSSDPASAPVPGTDQLRIVEADPEPATTPAQARDRAASAPGQLPAQEWHSIQLDADTPAPASRAAASSRLSEDPPLYVASFADRAMAGVVDLGLTLAAFLAFVLVFAACTTHPPSGRIAVVGAALTLLATWILYQLVFFGLSDATPGMRYAKIALCTFDDENPTPSAMRRRIAALLFSALPLGLGLVWAAFDEDTLSWHDRITRTYQRSYREP